MNIYLIHGDDYLTSYERLQMYIGKARERGFHIVNIENKSDDIAGILRSKNLFDFKQMVVVNNYQLIISDVLNFLKDVDYDLHLVIYHEGTIPVSFIKKLPEVSKNEVFELSKSLWKFVENFYPGNIAPCLTYFHQSIKNNPVEMVFSILSGHLRDIFLILNSENLPYPAWRLQKLKYISEKFGIRKIKMVIKELSEIDIRVKTSNVSLKDELDLFILRKLK